MLERAVMMPRSPKSDHVRCRDFVTVQRRYAQSPVFNAGFGDVEMRRGGRFGFR